MLFVSNKPSIMLLAISIDTVGTKGAIIQYNLFVGTFTLLLNWLLLSSTRR